MPQARDDLAELVALRSVADPKVEPPEECAKAADWVVAKFAEAGLRDARALSTPDGSRCVYGHAPGPDGTPTVLLYSHYDVQPPVDDEAWRTPVWQLTERDGRWYGRGTADCKGNIVMHLTALRALRRHGELPCSIAVICEGSEEQGTGGLEAFVPDNADLLRADAILVADTGNFAAGTPTLTTRLRGMASVDVTLSALAGPVHSGMFGGPTPDPVFAMIRLLATLQDERGNTTIDGVNATGSWAGVDYPESRFRADAQVLAGVELAGDGTVADRLWARPAVTVLGMDVPRVVGSSAAVQASVTARVSVRLPPGTTGEQVQDSLMAHLRARVPFGMRCDVERVAVGDPFVGSLSGPAFHTMWSAMEEAYGTPVVTEGQGGSIPLCNVLADTFPEAEIMLFGVEEPQCLIHAPNESVDPAEIERTALAEALFLRGYATTGTR